ncbi:endonuclease III domain-containing protein [Terriglobus albidus]|uniref:endonuclease III domain-containing protein n=1 Tax=Terriglobus albidus TaxID=1592106 RepID=UPI0021DF6D39|nr:iron-sulfur cluster loop [Terriglobus albidus]
MSSLFEPTPPDILPELHQRLLAFYGKPAPRDVWDPLTQLIYSLLSARTKTEVSLQIIRDLRNRFDGWQGDWTRLRDASIAEIEEVIRPVTHYEKKSHQLKETLRQISDRIGVLRLEPLGRYRTEKIRAWIEQLPGVGVKTSAAVVNFTTLRRRALCIDGHHQRIAQRLGLSSPKADARQVEADLMALVPEDWTPEMLDEDHSLFKLHGQTLCTKNELRCGRCPLLDVCPTGKQRATPKRGLYPLD